MKDKNHTNTYATEMQSVSNTNKDKFERENGTTACGGVGM